VGAALEHDLVPRPGHGAARVEGKDGGRRFRSRLHRRDRLHVRGARLEGRAPLARGRSQSPPAARLGFRGGPLPGGRGQPDGECLWPGLRAFERVFQLADYVQVKGAALENGLLHVDLVREIPEAKKPRQIPIGNGQAKVVEAKAA